MDQQTFRHIRDLRKRRGVYRSDDRARREMQRIVALLPAGSLEREVFERAEIHGATYKSIAAALGVSERHMYRIRRRMIEMIDAAERYAGAGVAWDRRPDVELAATFLRYGHTRRAVETIRQMGSARLNICEQVELSSIEAMAACDLGSFQAAEETLGRMRAITDSLSGPERASAKHRIAMTAAYASYCQGLYEEALATCEAALAPILARPPAAVDAADVRSIARDAIFLGVVHQEGGSPERAIETLTFAQELLHRSADAPLGELAIALVHRAFARAALPGGLQRARQDADRGLSLACRHGLLYEQVWARLASGVLYEFDDDAASALAEVQQALDLARAVLSGDPLARTHFITTRVEIFAGWPNQALEHLSEARPLVAPDSLLGTIVELVEARVHGARNDPRATFHAASRAIAAFERRHTSTHYLGAAYLGRAAAGEKLGLDARADAEAAVVLLSRGGWIADQRRALQLSARLTANRQHERMARELHA